MNSMLRTNKKAPSRYGTGTCRFRGTTQIAGRFPGHFDPFNAGKTLRFAHSSEEAPTISTGIFQPGNPSLADAAYVVNLVIAFGILIRIIIIRKDRFVKAREKLGSREGGHHRSQWQPIESNGMGQAAALWNRLAAGIVR
ncbi:MAG: hypothetical protein SOY88_10070 [Massilioclostridium sp.]|nr:hypothetical protein [Massilioclostridium sp.]